MGGHCWNHPYHCHRPRQNCGPAPVTPVPVPPVPPPNISVFNINITINYPPPAPLPAPAPAPAPAPTPAPAPAPVTGGSGTAKPAPPSSFDAIYLVDLWEQNTFPTSEAAAKDWLVTPAGKAIWYYANANLETMNAGLPPDREFLVPGNLPNGFDWEAYTIDCQDATKNTTLRIGVLEGANTVGRDYLLPGDGSCRTVGSAGRYVKDAPFGVVIPVRRDELSTLISVVKNPGYMQGGRTSKVPYLEARCRYYISCARPPRSQILLVPNKLPSATEAISRGQNFVENSFAGGAAEVSDTATGDTGNTQKIQEPVQLNNDDNDVEEDPNEDYEQMQGSALPAGFDAGDNEEWKGKLISDATLGEPAPPALDPVVPPAIPDSSNPSAATESNNAGS